MIPRLNSDGVRRLAARVINLCVAEAHRDPCVLATAVEWSTWCGFDPHAASHGLINRVLSGDVPELSSLDAGDDDAKYFEVRLDYHYSEGRQCPVCNVPITNTASACRRHLSVVTQ